VCDYFHCLIYPNQILHFVQNDNAMEILHPTRFSRRNYVAPQNDITQQRLPRLGYAFLGVTGFLSLRAESSEAWQSRLWTTSPTLPVILSVSEESGWGRFVWLICLLVLSFRTHVRNLCVNISSVFVVSRLPRSGYAFLGVTEWSSRPQPRFSRRPAASSE